MSEVSNFVYQQGAQYLFNRAYSVSIAAPNNTIALQYGTLGNNPAPLRVKFDINKIGGTSNKSKIELYNLSAQSRQTFKVGYLVQLEAGYNGLTRILFAGNILNSISKRNGADIITSLECGDGEASITFASYDQSYPAGVTLVQILEDLTKALSLNVGSVLGIPQVTYNKGFTTHGSVRDALDKLLPPNGLEWNVNNGAVNIIPIDKHNGQSAIVLSKATGMIGVPSKGNDFTQATSLLNPQLVPGVPVQLISDTSSLNGFYKIRRSHFEGDSHEKKWEVSLEMDPITAAIQNLKPAQGLNFQPALTNDV